MKNKICGWLLLLALAFSAKAQVKMGDNPNAINSNSMLELESTNKGFLPPRVAIGNLNSASPLVAPVPAGMLVYSSGGSVADGYYFWDGSKWLAVISSAKFRDNHVIVKAESDLPAAVGGVITLASNVTYEVNGVVNIANKINLNNAIVKGAGGIYDVLNYTPGSGELFTGAAGGSIKQVILMAPNGGARIFNMNANGAAQNLIVESCRVLGSANVGNIKGYGGTVYLHGIVYQNNNMGITLENIGTLLMVNTVWDSSNKGTFEKLVGTFTNVQKANGNMWPLVANSATAFDISALASIVAGEFKNTLLAGNGTYINGSFSKQWEVEAQGLPTQKDATARGTVYITSTANTNFSSVGVPVKVQGTTASGNLFRVSAPGSNRLTYTGNGTRSFQVMCALSVTQTSSTRPITFYIAKNGVILPDSKQQVKLITDVVTILLTVYDQPSVVVTSNVELAPNDYVEVWVASESGTTPITVMSMNLSIY